MLLSFVPASLAIAGFICRRRSIHEKLMQLVCTLFPSCGKPFGCRYVVGIVDEARRTGFFVYVGQFPVGVAELVFRMGKPYVIGNW